MPVMFKDKLIAQNVSDLMLNISGLLDQSVSFVATNCHEDEVKSYAQAIGSIMEIIGLDVLNHIYKDHPEIKPPEYYLPPREL